MSLRMTFSILLISMAVSASANSWVKILNKQIVLESELQVSYKLDNHEPSRFHDIYSLLYAGSALLYAIRVPGGEGVLSISCGVITHAGTHTLTISYNFSTVIATTQFKVKWPVMVVAVPNMVKTYTMDVVVSFSFTKSLCTPLSVSGNNNNQRVLHGGQQGLMTAWVRVEKCETKTCDDSKVIQLAKVKNLYNSHSSKVNIPCKDWGVAGLFRVVIKAEIDAGRHVDDQDSVIATSRVFSVDLSSEYDLSTNRVAIEPCQEGDSLVVEMNYPPCILDKDKIRLHQETGSHGTRRRKYIGEQRVIPGDKAVIFPCSAFNKTSSGDRFCFSYVSTAVDEAVATMRTDCLPRQKQGGSRQVWEEWGSWSSCSASCGQGAETSYRFCQDTSPGTEVCKGQQVASRQCLLAKCTSILTSTSLAPSPSPRSTLVYGASPCACGCTYILHSKMEDIDEDIPSSDINIVSGICSTLPISWTVKVPSRHQMLLTLSNMSFSCPSLLLNIRDGLLPTDTILYQVMSKTSLPARIQSSSSILRLELQGDQPDTDLHSCYVVIHFTYLHARPQ